MAVMMLTLQGQFNTIQCNTFCNGKRYSNY